MRPLELARPFLAILPDVPAADRKIPFKDKGLYTAVALFVFLVCSQLPLYGIRTNSGSDPFYWARVIMASNRCWTEPWYCRGYSQALCGRTAAPALSRHPCEEPVALLRSVCEQGNVYGVGYQSHSHLRAGDAASGWVEDYRGQQQCEGRPRAAVRPLICRSFPGH